MVIAGFPILPDEPTEPVQEFGHAPDVIIMGMGTNDYRKQSPIGWFLDQVAISEGLHETGELARRGHVDHESSSDPSVVGRKEDELCVAVADIQQEVDQGIRRSGASRNEIAGS